MLRRRGDYSFRIRNIKKMCASRPTTGARFRIVCTAMVLLGAWHELGAQRALGASVGAALPIGGTADLLTIGDHSGLFVVFRPPVLVQRARVDFTWSNLKDRNTSGVTHHVFWIALGAVIETPTSVPGPRGYVILGAGSYHQKRPGVRRDAAGLSAGAGLEFRLGPFGAFGEARIHYVLDGARTKLFPLGIGLRF